MNFADNLERSAFFFPDRPAVSEEGVETTCAELNERADKVATSLIKMGVQPGDHIAFCAPNSVDWIAFYFGVLKAGAVAVTLSWLLTGDELARHLHHSKPKMIGGGVRSYWSPRQRVGRTCNSRYQTKSRPLNFT
ncbi:MAG: AMP-binding protein [Armatimonadetes bacterium]|nr:AMP-binding protein [Armatimonadota bacterium]